MHGPPPPQEPQPPDSRRAALLGLVVTIILVVIGLIVIRVLTASSQLQDCVMSGRTNCAPLDVPPAR